MIKKDARSLSQDCLEEKRFTAISLRKKGISRKEVAAIIGVTAETVSKWSKMEKLGGKNALKKGKRGRKFSDKRKLTPEQEKEIKKLIIDKTPDQYKLPFALWNRESIRILIEQKYGVIYCLPTMSRVLKRWGFTPQKPKKLAYEQNPKAVKEWKENEYPKVATKAKAECSEILWLDETCVKAESNNKKSYAPKGKTPVVRKCAKHLHQSLISAISNRGKMEWMALSKALDVDQFIRFLKQLIKYRKKKIVVILDNLKVHHANLVKEWLVGKESKIELVFLPSYSPEINPIEYKNGALKKRMFRSKFVHTKEELSTAVSSEMNDIKKDKKLVKSFFNHKDVTYTKCNPFNDKG